MLAKKKYLRSARPLSIGRLSRVFERAKQLWALDPRFDADIILISRLHYMNPRFPEIIASLASRRLAIRGEIDIKESPFPIFLRVLNSIKDYVFDFDVIAKVGFNEAASRQNNIYHDSASIHVADSVYYFNYRANGAVLADAVYRRKFMRRLESEPGLPLLFIEEDQFYELKHSAGGRLRILDSEGRGRNPTAFSCEIVDASATKLVELLKNFLTAFGSSRRFRQHWEVYTRGPEKDSQFGNSDANIRLYKKLSTEPELFPASRYELRFDCTLQNESCLEDLRSLWKPQDRVYAALGAFETPGGGHLSLHGITQDVGHWLWVEVQGELGSQELESHLGIEFEEIQEGWAIWDKE